MSDCALVDSPRDDDESRPGVANRTLITCKSTTTPVGIIFCLVGRGSLATLNLLSDSISGRTHQHVSPLVDWPLHTLFLTIRRHHRGCSGRALVVTQFVAQWFMARKGLVICTRTPYVVMLVSTESMTSAFRSPERRPCRFGSPSKNPTGGTSGQSAGCLSTHFQWLAGCKWFITKTQHIPIRSKHTTNLHVCPVAMRLP